MLISNSRENFSGNENGLRRLLIHGEWIVILAASKHAKLRTENDHLDHPSDVCVVLLNLHNDGIQQRLIGELHRSAECIAEQFASELSEKRLPLTRQQPGPQSFDADREVPSGKVVLASIG